MRKTILLAALLATSVAAEAQRRLPVIIPIRGQPQQPALQGVDALRADFVAKVGGETVYFAGENVQLTPQARTQLQAQAQWLLQHPLAVVRIEGHGDGGDTRSHALGVGARRAEEARNYLLLLGVPAAQVTTMSWGKERPGPPRIVTVVVR